MRPIELEKAIDCLGGVEVLRSTARCFLTEIDSMMEIMDQAVRSGNPELIQEKAHWVKGGLFYLHAKPSSEAAKKLESTALLGPAEVQIAHESLCREIADLKVALGEIVAESVKLV